MDGIETIHTVVFPVLNTPRLICSAAEMETERSWRIHFIQRFISFYFTFLFSDSCPFTPPNPLLLSIIYFQLNGHWRIPPVCSVEQTESSSDKATWRSCWFSMCMYFSFDLLIVHTCAVPLGLMYVPAICSQKLLHSCICYCGVRQSCS